MPYDQITTELTKFSDVFMGRIEAIEGEIVSMKDGATAARHHRGKSGQSLGDQFVSAFEAERSLFAKTGKISLELKASTDPITTANARNLASGGVGVMGLGVLGIQNAFVPRPSQGVSAVEYSRLTSVTGAAGVQAGDGAAKPSVRPDFTLINQSALTIAGWSTLSKQALGDSAELKYAVEVTLARSIAAAMDDALIKGTTTPAWAGLKPLAIARPPSLIYGCMVDAISEGVSSMQIAGFNPDVVSMHPSEWLAIISATGLTNDHYLIPDGFLNEQGMVLRGLRVILSASLAVGEALVLDSAHTEIQLVDGLKIEVGTQNDQFVKNLVTVLGEMRIIPVFRTVGSAVIVNPKV